jgi:hypothetical protein
MNVKGVSLKALRRDAAYVSERTRFMDEAHRDLVRLVRFLRKKGHVRWANKMERLVLDTSDCTSDEAEADLRWSMRKGR